MFARQFHHSIRLKEYKRKKIEREREREPTAMTPLEARWYIQLNRRCHVE